MATALTTPALYLFAISHYCEKARWALDYCNIEYRGVALAPGPHIQFCRSLGLSDTTLPVLVEGEQATQGSAQIVDWAEARGVGAGRSFEAETDRLACREIEQRLDETFGVHVRRYFYSEALLTKPQQVRPMFCKGLPWSEQIIIRLGWNKICRHMIRSLDLGPEQGRESRQVLETELDWLDEMLADGRRYLVGERFSRADLAAASLVAPLALPREHPTYHSLQIPPGIAADFEGWRERPTLRWVHEMYRLHRQPL